MKKSRLDEEYDKTIQTYSSILRIIHAVCILIISSSIFVCIWYSFSFGVKLAMSAFFSHVLSNGVFAWVKTYLHNSVYGFSEDSANVRTLNRKK